MPTPSYPDVATVEAADGIRLRNRIARISRDAGLMISPKEIHSELNNLATWTAGDEEI
ncbi:hypothetical protein [Thermococcus piezophilus]|uniref:hypothetical protein n=1 Tax=Thermococcus piezophilus TaxID=1712654 RepID=UPI000A643E8D|nr:hypothetical protein [Thermococcus piezophilus]